MKKSSVIGPLALLTATTAAAIGISTFTSTDPHYGAFPKFMAAAFWSALGLTPAAIWIGLAHFKRSLAKALVLLQAITLLGFLALNVGMGGFGFQMLSFVFLAGCILASLPVTLVLLFRVHRDSHRPDAREPISERSAAPERAAGRGLNKPGNE